MAAPLVDGAAAVLERALPALTVDQYRSLLVNDAAQAFSPPGLGASIQQAGAGVLDVLASLNATAAASPASLSFGQGGTSPNVSQMLTLTNVGASADTFQLSVIPTNSSAPAPQLPSASVQLAPGGSVSIPVLFQANGMTAGAYDGFIAVQGTLSGYASRIPYWYAVPSFTPAFVTVLYNVGSQSPQTAGSRLSQAVLFRVTDSAGLPIAGLVPNVTALSTGSAATGLTSLDSAVPGSYTFSVRLSLTPGPNTFQIQAGAISTTVTITGQ